ncbi:MAG: ATP-binding cassette domain-containing protein [Chloroflexota bacterium]
MSIEATGIGYRYPGAAQPALSDVSVAVRPGEVVGIVGPNGSGKSTLGSILKGLLLPSAGKLVVDSFEPDSAHRRIRTLVGLLFQNPNSQIVNAVVEHEVAFGPENMGLATAEVRARVDEALAAVSLTEQAEANCHELTMADKQRVALAAVLAMRPRYLILDEPTTWIEPPARWPLLLSTVQHAREGGMGVLLITHRMEETAIADRLYGMRGGRVHIEGRPREILADEDSRRLLSLDIPDIVEEGDRLRQAGLPVTPGEPVPMLTAALTRPRPGLALDDHPPPISEGSSTETGA